MIVGLSFTKIASERTDTTNGSIDVNYGPDVTSVESTEVNALDEDVAQINFTFPITYEQDGDEIGNITIDGKVLWKEDEDADDVLEQWEDDETLPNDVNIAVINHLYRKCLPEAVSIANRLDLPSPIPVPRARKAQ